MTDRRRITLVTRDPKTPQRDWDLTNPAGSRIIFVDSIAFLPHAIARGMNENHDIERVIIDRTGNTLQFIELLAALPAEFAGDVLFTPAEGKAFLSSRSRGDGRLLYAMTTEDVEFYLQTHALAGPFATSDRRATQFATA